MRQTKPEAGKLAEEINSRVGQVIHLPFLCESDHPPRGVKAGQ
jgi:hypothetical protein